MIIIESIAGGLRLTDTATGEVYDLAGDAERRRLGELIRCLACERYASGHSDGLTEAYKRVVAEAERREQLGPVKRARLALN